MLAFSKSTLLTRTLLTYHSLQNRNVICSIFFSPSVLLGAGEAMAESLGLQYDYREFSNSRVVRVLYFASQKQVAVCGDPAYAGLFS
jgi:hypothetical protein